MVKEQLGLRLHGTGVIHGGEVIVAGGENDMEVCKFGRR